MFSNHDYFVKKSKISTRYLSYIFENEKELAQIRIPLSSSFEVTWFFQHKEGHTFPILEMSETPLWFQKLVKKAIEEVERKERVRNLFK